VRLAVLRARIPRYQLAMLKYFAEEQRTTVSEVLTRELEGVAKSMPSGCRRWSPASALRWHGPMPGTSSSRAETDQPRSGGGS
jgi:hypothetical protein